MASVNAAGVVDNVTPAETIKSGFDKHNSHWHDYDAVLLTNSAAGSTAVGDVLAVSTAGDSAAVLGDAVSSFQEYVVAQAVIANAVTGEFARAGVVSAKSTGTIARGQYIRKSATARSVEDSGTSVGATVSPPAGTLGLALAAAVGGFVTMMLFDQTTTVGVTLINRAASRVQHSNSTIETTVYSYSVPGGTLSTDRALRLNAVIWYSGTAGGTSTFTVRAKYGATTIFSAAYSLVQDASNRGATFSLLLSARGATNTQSAQAFLDMGAVGTDGGVAAAPALPMIAVHNAVAEDSTLAKTLAVTFQHSVANASIVGTIEGVQLEHL